MLHHRNLAAKMRRRSRRFLRYCGPLRLGQTSVGFIVAVALIFLWTMERPAAAVVVAPTGHTENEYFTLYWEYDLAAGHGSLMLKAMDIPDVDRVDVTLASFSTRGVGLWPGWEPYDPSWHRLGVVGQEAGQDVYGYDRWYHYDAASPVLSAASFGSLIFPTEGVTLGVRQMTLGGYLVGAEGSTLSGIATAIGPLTMDFVTVQAVPEPGTIALAGLGAVLASAVAKRRPDEDEPAA